MISFNQEKHTFHLIDITNPGCKVVIGEDAIINPKVLAEEIEVFRNDGYSLDNLRISEKADIIMPYHIWMDEIIEKRKGNEIADEYTCGSISCNCDKLRGVGITVADFIGEDFRKIAEERFKIYIAIKEIFGYFKYCDYSALIDEYELYSEIIKPYVFTL